MRVPDDYLGGSVRCPYCFHIIPVQLTGITTEAPPDAGALPYEIIDLDRSQEAPLPRSARYAPGRGTLLLALGGTSIALSVLGLVGNAMICGAAVLFGPPAFGLGLMTWIMGQRDMELLRRAIIDPHADQRTRLGWVPA
jgi:hypothetical protein